MSIAQEQQIRALEARIQELLTRETIGWVGAALGQALATQLAATPYSRWTTNQKLTLHSVCGDAVTAYDLYVSQLPKE